MRSCLQLGHIATLSSGKGHDELSGAYRLLPVGALSGFEQDPFEAEIMTWRSGLKCQGKTNWQNRDTSR